MGGASHHQLGELSGGGPGRLCRRAKGSRILRRGGHQVADLLHETLVEVINRLDTTQ